MMAYRLCNCGDCNEAAAVARKEYDRLVASEHCPLWATQIALSILHMAARDMMTVIAHENPETPSIGELAAQMSKTENRIRNVMDLHTDRNSLAGVLDKNPQHELRHLINRDLQKIDALIAKLPKSSSVLDLAKLH